VQQVEQRTLSNVFEHNHDVRDLRNDAHEKSDVRVSKNTLHNDLVLDFGEKLVGESWVEDLFYGDRSPVEEPLVNDREPALPDLFAKLKITKCDLSDTWHLRESACSD